MKFRRVTASKYIGEFGYSLQEMRDGSFSIVKGNKVTRWGTKFRTIRLAENFLNSHDYLHASTDCIPMSSEDVDFIYEIYCTRGNPEFGNRWYITDNFWIEGEEGHIPDQDFSFKQFRCSDGTCYHNADELVEKLDILTNSIFSRTLEEEDVDVIFAKSTIVAKRAPMGSNKGGFSPKDLMRVKSSNVWAIGYQANADSMKEGTIYVQFKGKNGGPGDVYAYYDAPNTVYRKMITTPSKGAFVWKYLRYSFPYSKLTGDKRGKLPHAVN